MPTIRELFEINRRQFESALAELDRALGGVKEARDVTRDICREIAGVPRPEWMPAESLVPWLNRDGEAPPQGMTFSQFLETDSIFKPLANGIVSVIAGGRRYMIDLATRKGILRSLAEAHTRASDHSRENPALAEALRRAIYERFPDPRKPV